MSASPPPPPPPPGSPPPPLAEPAAWSRRALRDQRRAAALAARQQRDLVRLQMKAQRRGSLVGPLMLVGTGLLFLLVELGKVRPEAVLVWMSRWWPTVLLGAGLLLLAEWAMDTWVAGDRRADLPRRTLGSGAVFLLVLLTVVGLAATGLSRGSDWIHQNFGNNLADSWGLDQFFGQESETSQDLSAPFAAGSLLTIQSSRGNIRVIGSSPDGQVHVAVHQRVLGWPGDDSRTHRRRNAPALNRNGSGLRLTVGGDERDRTDLVIEVPHEAGLVLAPEKGDITVAELRGPVTIQQHVGNITLTGVAGPIQLSLNDDDATINGHSLSGGVTLDGRSGDLTFSDISGPLTLHGDFFGTSHLERIHGPVHFRSSFTDFACAGIPGELNVDGRNDLDANKLDGPVVLSTTNRDLTLAGVRGGATITNRNGFVHLGLVGAMAAVQVSTSDGSLQLHLPPGAPVSVAADTTGGKITNDLGLTSVQVADRTTLAGQVARGGPTVTLHTTDGDISIDHAGSPAIRESPSDPDRDVSLSIPPAHHRASSRPGSQV